MPRRRTVGSIARRIKGDPMDGKSDIDTGSSANTGREEDLFPVPSFEQAKKEQADLISELREGDSADQRVADLMSKCRKRSRCNLVQCPVCERRKLIAKNGVPAFVVKSLGTPDHTQPVWCGMAYSDVAMSTSRNATAWCSMIGLPKLRRSLAYASAAS
jgi:hypothetical protein